MFIMKTLKDSTIEQITAESIQWTKLQKNLHYNYKRKLLRQLDWTELCKTLRYSFPSFLLYPHFPIQKEKISR
jgi:hypothetical protein